MKTKYFGKALRMANYISRPGSAKSKETQLAGQKNIHGANKIFFELLISNWLGQCPSSLFSSDW